MTKEAKAEYDRKYRERKKEEIRLKKKLYSESENGRAMQKRQRQKRKEYHNEYCRKPEQRQKEKHRRHFRLNQLENKFCIVCEKDKPKIEFTASRIYQDGRMYLCKKCDELHKKDFGITTKSVIQVIVTSCDYKLTREDVAKYPYFIEAKKYSIILNKLTK